MKALTLRQPWSWAVAHTGKRVENRTWAPPASVIGQRIAIHAGLKLEKSSELRVFEMGYFMPGAFALGAVESVATIAGWVRKEPGRMKEISHVDLDEDLADSVIASPWWVGPIGWVLTDVIALPEPVPCRGAQGLWTLPGEVERAVLAQLEAHA